MSNKEAVRTNFEEKSAYFARSLPGMSVADHGDFLLVDSGVPSDTFNVIVARNLSMTQRLLNEGIDYFMRRRTPMALWYWEEGKDQTGMDALLTYGLTNNERDVAMVADLAQVKTL